jgi:hypothetical protein
MAAFEENNWLPLPALDGATTKAVEQVSRRGSSFRERIIVIFVMVDRCLNSKDDVKKIFELSRVLFDVLFQLEVEVYSSID